MRLANRLPLPISRRVIPRIPRRWQRFTSALTWAEAEAASIGYSEVPVADHLPQLAPNQRLTGNEAALTAAFKVALGGLHSGGEPVRVVDFGGNDGRHAHLMQGFFEEVSFDWVVVDLPAVVEAMSIRKRPGLDFESELAPVLDDEVDIVLASASLNYVPQPRETIDALCGSASQVVLARLPLWPIREHAAAVQHVQRRPNEISYPTWFFSEGEFLANLPAGSQVLMDFDCPDDRAAFAGYYLNYRGLVIDSSSTDVCDAL